jgi:hypothetical protein
MARVLTVLQLNDILTPTHHPQVTRRTCTAAVFGRGHLTKDCSLGGQIEHRIGRQPLITAISRGQRLSIFKDNMIGGRLVSSYCFS